MQLLITSGLAMSAQPAHCGSAHSQTMNGDDCAACATHDHGTGTTSPGLCKIACAMAGVAAPLQLRAFNTQSPRDIAAYAVRTLLGQSNPDDLLRPPAYAATFAA
jgi:hypothetical protein